jgi:acyl-coenzyme A thioesterase PaaI-like protein
MTALGTVFAHATLALAVVTGGAYSDAAFTAPLDSGLRAFYQRDFTTANTSFESALAAAPDNTLAIAFLNATAAQTPGSLDALIAREENRLVADPHGYTTQLRLGFSYLFAGSTGRDRDADAREAFDAAVAVAPDAAGAHVGLGILRMNERSATRAKVEFLAALARDPNDVLAREYLATLYQVDLKDPQRGLSYAIDVPNVVPHYADIDFHIASMLDDLRQFPAAADYATRGLEIDVGHVGEAGRHGYTLLARIYLDEKRPDDARRVLRASIAEFVDDRRCFACGPHNADGLHLEFEPDGSDGARSRVTLPPRMQGYREVAHGGIVMMLLDEAMAHACRFIGEKATTASCEIRFRKPVPLGTTLVMRGRYKERRRNVLFLEASLTLEDGTVLATAEGTFVSLGRL